MESCWTAGGPLALGRSKTLDLPSFFCLTPSLPPSSVWPDPGLRTPTNLDFLFVFVLFRFVECHVPFVLCVSHVHLSVCHGRGAFLAWCHPFLPACLPSLPAPRGGVGSVQRQTTGPWAEYQLPAPSSPPAPIFFPLWLVPLLPLLPL